jgi:hypothetical protein
MTAMRQDQDVRFGSIELKYALRPSGLAEAPQTCSCRHFPVVDLRTVTNRATGNAAGVGNVYVKRFLGSTSDLMSTSIKKLRKDPNKSVSA